MGLGRKCGVEGGQRSRGGWVRDLMGLEKGEGEGGLNERAGLGQGRGLLSVFGVFPAAFGGPSAPRGCSP